MHNFEVSGMTCGHCTRAVTDAVRRVDPQATVDVDLPTGRVTVQGGTAPWAQVAASIADEGYPVREAVA